MRKTCSAWRNVSDIVVVDGYFIPKNSTLISNMGSMHTNAERYEDPFEFIPERFMDNIKTMQASANGSIEQRDTYNFGWGRRICPGKYILEVCIENLYTNMCCFDV